MNEILKTIESPAWWVCVVIVSFFVNILAAYAKPIVDKIWASFSQNRRARLKDDQKKFDADVAKLLQSPNEVILMTLKEIKELVITVLALSLCAVCFGVSLLPALTTLGSKLPFLLGAILTLTLALFSLDQSAASARRLEATKKQSKDADHL